MIDNFDNITDEEFEIICEQVLPTQKSAFDLIRQRKEIVNGNIEQTESQGTRTEEVLHRETL